MSTNEDDTYLKCKNNNFIMRYDDNTLVVFFTTTHSKNKYLPEFKKAGVKLTLLAEGDFESEYVFAEKDINAVAKIMKPQVKGKNVKPRSKRNTLKK